MITKLTILALVFTIVFACTKATKETADIIYTNGKIYTVNEAQPWAEAVAIINGKFITVGSKGNE